MDWTYTGETMNTEEIQNAVMSEIRTLLRDKLGEYAYEVNTTRISLDIALALKDKHLLRDRSVYYEGPEHPNHSFSWRFPIQMWVHYIGYLVTTPSRFENETTHVDTWTEEQRSFVMDIITNKMKLKCEKGSVDERRGRYTIKIWKELPSGNQKNN